MQVIIWDCITHWHFLFDFFFNALVYNYWHNKILFQRNNLIFYSLILRCDHEVWNWPKISNVKFSIAWYSMDVLSHLNLLPGSVCAVCLCENNHNLTSKQHMLQMFLINIILGDGLVIQRAWIQHEVYSSNKFNGWWLYLFCFITACKSHNAD